MHMISRLSAETMSMNMLPLQCPDDDGTVAHRVCYFHNLVVFQSQLLYLYQGANVLAIACFFVTYPLPTVIQLCQRKQLAVVIKLTKMVTGPRAPQIPDILLNWHMDLHLAIVKLNASPRSRKFVVLKEAPVGSLQACGHKFASPHDQLFACCIRTCVTLK